MVQLELRKMLAVPADDMNEQDIEQWYEEVTGAERDRLDFELDRQQCENMFNIFRRILLYKGEQVSEMNLQYLLLMTFKRHRLSIICKF